MKSSSASSLKQISSKKSSDAHSSKAHQKCNSLCHGQSNNYVSGGPIKPIRTDSQSSNSKSNLTSSLTRRHAHDSHHDHSGSYQMMNICQRHIDHQHLNPHHNNGVYVQHQPKQGSQNTQCSSGYGYHHHHNHQYDHMMQNHVSQTIPSVNQNQYSASLPNQSYDYTQLDLYNLPNGYAHIPQQSIYESQAAMQKISEYQRHIQVDPAYDYTQHCRNDNHMGFNIPTQWQRFPGATEYAIRSYMLQQSLIRQSIDTYRMKNGTPVSRHIKRPSDEGERLKRAQREASVVSNVSWEYELSQDLRQKQIEILARKYGGEARAGRAARVIQQAFRRYSLDKNFAKLRLEMDDRKRMSRRFTEAGRSRTIWTDPGKNENRELQHQVSMPEEMHLLQDRSRPAPVLPNQREQNDGDCRLPMQSQYSVYMAQPGNRMIAEQRFVTQTMEQYIMTKQNHALIEEHITHIDTKPFRSTPLSFHCSANNEIYCSRPAIGFCCTANEQFQCNNHYSGHPIAYNSEHFQDMSANDVAEYEAALAPRLPLDSLDDEFGEVCLSRSAFGSNDVHNDSSKLDASSSDGTNSDNIKYIHENYTNESKLLCMDSSDSPVWKRMGSISSNYESCVANQVNSLSSKMPSPAPDYDEPRSPDTGSISSGSQSRMSNPSSSNQISSFVSTPPSCNQNNCTETRQIVMPRKSKISDKQRKRSYRIGLNLFNKKPERGINYLIERHFLDNRPAAIARFLIARKGLSKQMIGEYLGNLQIKFNMEVLRCFVEEIDLTGYHIDVALRKFQSYFRMPGEAQKIERLMEAFASQFCLCNPEMVQRFQRPDTVFLLAFASIMLNTDLHNKNIKPERKMKVEEFIKNLRGIDDGQDVETTILTGIYERIGLSPFSPGSDHVTQVAKVESMIIGKKPQLAVLSRRLVCYCRLYEVYDPTKREKLGLHQREVFLFNDMLLVTKIANKKKNNITYSFRNSFSLNGMIVYLFESPHYKYGIRLACDSNGKSGIMLNARNENDLSKFVEDLKEAILEMNEMEALRIEEELMKQQQMSSIQKRCSYNRHSKDSGVVDIELLVRPSSDSNPSSPPVNPLGGGVNMFGVAKRSSPSIGDTPSYIHRGSAGSLDSGLVSLNT